MNSEVLERLIPHIGHPLPIKCSFGRCLKIPCSKQVINTKERLFL